MKDTHASALARKRWKNAPAADRERLKTLRSKPTTCTRCGCLQPTARLAAAHCRKKGNKKAEVEKTAKD